MHTTTVHGAECSECGDHAVIARPVENKDIPIPFCEKCYTPVTGSTDDVHILVTPADDLHFEYGDNNTKAVINHGPGASTIIEEV